MSEFDNTAVLEGAEIPEQETDADSGASDFNSSSQDANLKAPVSELQRARDEKAAKEAPPRPYHSDVTGKPLVPEIPGDEPLSPRKAAQKTSDWREQKTAKAMEYETYIQSMLDDAAGQSASTDANAAVVPDGQQPPPAVNELPQPDASIEEKRAALEAQRQQLSQQWQQNIAQYDAVIPQIRAATEAVEADWEKAAATLNVKTATDYQNLRVTNPSAFDILERARGDIHHDRVLIE
jgi:hypothetical protein